jgi:DNA-directed RNA polymerase sigma subunit (sigma70/sigma32)
LSLLRQCLENAMATELSPHERDIIRLRLGLDDGVSRSVKDVIEVCGGTLSYTEVRNAELRAFNKLRAPYAVHTEQLLAYLHFIGVTVDTLPEKRIRRP